MGTRGFFAFKYKGYYYIKYNHLDSYPEGLGQDLVDAIPVSQEQFEQWLEAERKHIAKLSSSSDYKKSKSSPKNDLFIEWTYTYDLDNLLFIVDSKAHFSLRGVAQKPGEEWIVYISVDARGNRCLSLDTPPDLIGQFKCVNNVFLGDDPVPAVDDFVPTSTIPPSTWSKPLTRHYRRLMLAQVHATIAETYSVLSMISKYDPSDTSVQDFTMAFLDAILSNNQALVMNRYSLALEISNKEESPRNRGPWFWHRGCLILLATSLDDNHRFQIYVQAVTARAKAKNRDRCTAILWSIRHVAVVEISGDNVSHSDPIPLLAAYGLDEEAFINALHLLWHYLPYPRSRIVGDQATSRATAMPTEIVTKIMTFTDQLHYPKYQFLSRSFFKLWWGHPRVGSYMILPDAEEVAETSRCFKAYSADENLPVELRLKCSWGKQTGNIWRSDKPSDSSTNPENVWWGLRCRQEQEEAAMALIDDRDDFSRGSMKYRLQRFYSYWPEDLPVSNKYCLPRVSDQFCGQSEVLFCDAEPI